MSRQVTAVLSAISMIVALGLSGCGQSISMSLKFSPEQTTQYKSTSEVIKDFRFEQPNLGKLREEQTKTVIEMACTQTIESVDESGNANAKITIDGLKVDIVNKNESRLAFDSQKDTNSPLAKLIGQSYTIQLAPTGQAKVLDAKAAMAAVPAGYEKKVAEGILSPEAIADRHGIQSLPEAAQANVSVRDTWTRVVPSPPGLLAPKSYQKVYTLDAIANNTIAEVSMKAVESAQETSGSASTGGMGMFAKMFDNTDDYTGSMKIDLASGQVLTAQETLISTYTALEMPENGDPDKGPDTLTMKFTNRILLEKLN